MIADKATPATVCPEPPREATDAAADVYPTPALVSDKEPEAAPAVPTKSPVTFDPC